MTRPGLEPGPFEPESSALTIRPPRLPRVDNYNHMLPSSVCVVDCVITPTVMNFEKPF